MSYSEVARHARRAARGLPLALAAWGLVATSLPAAAAAPAFSLPPITQVPAGATPEHHAGKPVWAELITPDLAGAKLFYGGLLGWTFQDLHALGGDYAVAYLNGRPVAGLLQQIPANGHHPAWLTFLAAADVDTAVRLAVDHGAKVVYGARTFPDRGRQAVLADPEGAVFAVLASSSGDPPDYLPDVGQWIWSSLLANNPDTDAAFYQSVLGYEVFPLTSVDDRQHLLLASDDSARASINTLPEGLMHRHPHWLDFVRVNDAGALAIQAVRLGGRVLVEPQADRHGGMVAVVADPSGAAIGLMEWTETGMQP